MSPREGIGPRTAVRGRFLTGNRFVTSIRLRLRIWTLLALSAACAARAAPAATPPAFDACFDLHGATYGVDPQLLRAMARTESSMRPEAMNLSHASATGSVDIGLMQINSRWLPQLQRYGITRDALRDPCTNIEVGAWILADLLKRKGNHWDAVGSWNAACTQLKGEACRRARAKFAWKVHRNWRDQPARELTARQAPRSTLPPVALWRVSDLRAPKTEAR